MIQESEGILFVLGSGMFAAILANIKWVTTLPRYRWLVAGYGALYLGWIFTILEGFWFTGAFNVVEHIFYTLSMICITIWSMHIFAHKEAA